MSLFQSTVELAHRQAVKNAPSMRHRILEKLTARPLALFEVAAALGVQKNVISGRFTDLMRDGQIDRTGERRRDPASGCHADAWRICPTPLPQRALPFKRPNS